MFLLNWIPDFVFHVTLIIGILGILASFVLQFIPFIARFTIPIQVVSIILTLIGVWFEGGMARDREYREAILAMEVKVADSERRAAEASAKIEYVFVDKIKTVKDVQVVVQEKIRDVAIKIDDQCKITTDVIDILNEAAKKPK